MSKLNQEELLGQLDSFKEVYLDACILDEAGIIRMRQAYQQIKEMIQKPEVTEEWIEEKGLRIACKYGISQVQARKIIRSLVEEIK